MKRFVVAVLVMAAITVASNAHAHFQLVYTPEQVVLKNGLMPFKLIFWHPFENGHAMDMAKPESFFVVHKGQRTDLMGSLKPITFHGAENKANAFELSVPVNENGDYVFVLTPVPYWEDSETQYIHQITKVIINKGGLPTDWEKPVGGLPTEIVPLTNPYTIPTGSTFTGQVLTEGKPAPGLQIEVEYMACEPDLKDNKPGKAKASPMPGGTIIVTTDANGVFTFGIPKAGWWGFSAIESGPLKELKGKKVEQDAVMWVQAHDLLGAEQK